MPNLWTRRGTGHFSLGQPAPLSQKKLPTEAEVYNAIVHKKQQWQIENNNFSTAALPMANIKREVAIEVINLWEKRATCQQCQSKVFS